MQVKFQTALYTKDLNGDWVICDFQTDLTRGNANKIARAMFAPLLSLDTANIYEPHDYPNIPPRAVSKDKYVYQIAGRAFMITIKPLNT